MNKNISRRNALKFVAASVAASGIACTSTGNNNSLVKNLVEKPNHSPMHDKWHKTFDRTWLGGEYWANPMEDWHIVNGEAQCKSDDGQRSVHSLTHRINVIDQAFTMAVTIRKIKGNSEFGSAGFRLGVNSDINEYRSSCFVQRGLDVGIVNNQLSIAGKTSPLSEKITDQAVILSLSAEPQVGAVLITLVATLAGSGKAVGKLSHLVPGQDIIGNVAVVSNFTLRSGQKVNTTTGNLYEVEVQKGNLYSFSQWSLEGDAFDVIPERKFGPLLWTMYSLNNSRSDEGYVMKLSAFTGPMGKDDSQHVDLQIKQAGSWQSIGKSKLDPDAWLAQFRIANWNPESDTPYRVVYIEKHNDGSETPDIYSGVIKAEPKGKKLRLVALTCQNDYSFPYAPVADNVVKVSPDLVYFSGDQIYESHGGFGIVREPFDKSMHNYLRKFYQFGWAFREAMRNQPTLCLPDDHDVLQGNLWGEEGERKKDYAGDPGGTYTGGYIHPVRFVNAVHKTCVGHHPDPYDPTPNRSGISVYYSNMVYGNVSFAILADRQWKTGPEQAGVVVGGTGLEESPTSFNPNLNGDNPQILGVRQEEFLEKWGQDWQGHELKVILSQTVFAGLGTHQPTKQRYLKYDFDSDGWPAPARNRAVAAMRASKALHVCGDTHLVSLAQYGLHQQRDSNWSFCTPAISAGWPRWWLPDQVGIPHRNRPSHGLPQTGEFKDAFGNLIYVYAIGVPDEGLSGNRYVKAHEKGSGFGLITMDTEKKSYTINAYRYLVNLDDNNAQNQFDGFPVTIYQEENNGRNILS